MPPDAAQAPIAKTQRGSAICRYTCFKTGPIFLAIVPITINKSHCRGVNAKRSEPKRARSYVELMVLINSIPQQLVAKGKGQIEFFLASATIFSKLVAK